MQNMGTRRHPFCPHRLRHSVTQRTGESPAGRRGIAFYQKHDYAQALPYFEQAQQAGHMKAPRYLGLMYLNGEGIAKNAQTAFAYFTQAAAAGDITGQYWLGYCYENGIGTAKDMTQAVRWYQKSAERGDHVSQPAIDALNRLGIKAN